MKIFNDILLASSLTTFIWLNSMGIAVVSKNNSQNKTFPITNTQFDTLACERILFATLFNSNSNFKDIVKYHNKFNHIVDSNLTFLRYETVENNFIFSNIHEFNGTYIGKAKIYATQNDVIFNIDFNTLKVFIIRIDRKYARVLSEEYFRFMDFHKDYLENLPPNLRLNLMLELIFPDNYLTYLPYSTTTDAYSYDLNFLVDPTSLEDTSGFCFLKSTALKKQNSDSINYFWLCDEKRDLTADIDVREIDFMTYEFRFNSGGWTDHYEISVGEWINPYEIIWYIGERNLGPTLEFY